MTEILKRYIDASNAFRKAADCHEGAIALYDLLYDLQAKTERTKEEERILTDTYTLLEYHLSAYETFLRIADTTNYKEKSKLLVLEDKARTHKNTFCIKDIRQSKVKKKQKTLKVADFEKVEDFESECEYVLSTKKVVILGKEVEGEDFSFFINKGTPLESCLDHIKEYLAWLSEAKETLISYYNEHCRKYIPQADDNWYDTLEVYSGHIDIGSTGVTAHISAGDIFTPDHLLDIDFEGKEITHIGWDG